MNLSPAITGFLGLGLAFFLIPLVLKFCSRRGFQQRPTDWHHTHKGSVPRLGGLVLAATFIGVEVFIAICYPEERARLRERSVVVLGSLAMFGLGFWDDLRPLGAKKKLLGQIAIATTVCLCGVGIQLCKIPFTGQVISLGGWGVLITVLWLVGMTNLINLIDGVDGLAGGISLMLMVLIAFVAHQDGNFELLASGMAGALLGFLWFNFPPARIYMGDGGAYFLGFQIGLYSVVNSHKGTVFAALAAPLFVLALPILDTGLAILRRGLRGLPIFRPDRHHIHHHLIGMGLSRRRVVLSLYALTLVFLAMGLTAFWSKGQLVPVLLGAAVLLLLICAGNLNFSREWFAVGRVLGNSLGMRQDVQYALSLAHWLELEGRRASSVESLWTDLQFAAQKLGFTGITLTLPDGERTWTGQEASEQSQMARFDLQQGRFGRLELRGRLCPLQDPEHGHSCERNPDCKRASSCISDPRLFEITGELLAEAWTKAAANCLQGSPAPLRFDARLQSPARMLSRRWMAAWLARGTQETS